MTDTTPLLDEQGPTEGVPDAPRSRRQLLTMAGAAVAGGTALALGGASPASAADGDAILAGESNSASSETTLTSSGGVAALGVIQTTEDLAAIYASGGGGETGPDVKLVGTGRLAQYSAAEGTAQPAFSPTVSEIVRGDGGLIWATAPSGWKRINAVRFDKPSGDGTAFSPFRLLDTRTGSKRNTNTNYVTDVAGNANIPDDAIAIFGNVTVVSPNWTGFLTLFPTGTSVPTVANLNFSTNEIAGNFFMVGLGTGANAGELSVRAGDVGGKTYHVIIDVFGYVQ